MQFWEIAGARHVALFLTKCVIQNGLPKGGKNKLCKRTGSVLQFHGLICSDHGRIIVESCSNPPRAVNDDSCALRQNLNLIFLWQAQHLALLDLLESQFSWQGQCFGMLKCDSCCTGQCTGFSCVATKEDE